MALGANSGFAQTGDDAHVTIKYVNEMSDSYTLEEVYYAFDDSQAVRWSGSYDDRFTLFDGKMPSGRHKISVFVTFRGAGYGALKHMRRYRFKVNSDYQFSAQRGNRTTVNVTSREKGGFFTELKDRPEVAFDMSAVEDPELMQAINQADAPVEEAPPPELEQTEAVEPIAAEAAIPDDANEPAPPEPEPAPAHPSFENVYFKFGSSKLRASARPALDNVAAFLKRDPGLRLEVVGHTDSTGPKEFNLKLSKRRSAAVRNYLTSQGVEASRITVMGLGEGNPAESNDTKAGRAMNRRTEFNVSRAENPPSAGL